MSQSLTALYLQNPELANALRKREAGQALMQQGMDSSPIQHWSQGAARLAAALIGGYESNRGDKEIKEFGDRSKAEMADFTGLLSKALTGGGGAAPASGAQPMAPPMTAPPPGPVAQAPMAPPDLAPFIEEQARARGIPPSLATSLFGTESNFNPQARNPRSGAFGIGQVLASTAANPGYGMQPISAADLGDARKAIPWSLDYLKARGGALGVSDFNDPQQAARALRAYGENTDEYERKVLGGAGMMPGAQPVAQPGQGAPQGMPQAAPRQGGGIDPRSMQMLAIQASQSNNPRIQAMAPLLMQMAKGEDQTTNLPPGGQLLDKRTGRVIATNTTVNPTVSLTNDMRGPGAYDVDRGKTFAARATAFEDAETSAAQKLRTIGRFRSALENVETGFGSAASITAGQIADKLNIPEATLKALGITREQTASKEQIRSLASGMVLESLGGSLGAGFSNADRDFLERIKPGLLNSKEGNLALLKIEEEAANRNRAIGRAWRDWRKTNGDNPDSVRRFEDEKMPSLQAPDGLAQRILDDSGWRDVPAAGQGGEMPTISNPADADRLPPGTQFRTPDGTVRRVPAQ